MQCAVHRTNIVNVVREMAIQQNVDSVILLCSHLKIIHSFAYAFHLKTIVISSSNINFQKWTFHTMCVQVNFLLFSDYPHFDCSTFHWNQISATTHKKINCDEGWDTFSITASFTNICFKYNRIIIDNTTNEIPSSDRFCVAFADIYSNCFS